MRLDRNTIVLIVISLIVIVGVVVIQQVQQASRPTPIPGVTGTPGTAQPTAPGGGPIFTSAQSSSIVRFEVRNNTSGQFTVVTRNDQMIWTVADATFKSDRATDQTITVSSVNNFIGLVALQRLTDVNLADFGLTAPAYTLTASQADNAAFKVNVGTVSPRGNAYYTQVGDGTDVVLLPKASIDLLIGLVNVPPYVPQPTNTPAPTNTPDASIALFTGLTQDMFISLEIRDNASGQVTTLTRQANLTWQITQTSFPTDRATDQFGVLTAVNNFVGVRYTDRFNLADIPGATLAGFGLETPAYVITGTTTTGMRHQLLVGGLNPDGTRRYVLARQEQLPPTATPTPPPTATPTLNPASTLDPTAALLATANALQTLAAQTTPLTPVVPATNTPGAAPRVLAAQAATATGTPVPPSATSAAPTATITNTITPVPPSVTPTSDPNALGTASALATANSAALTLTPPTAAPATTAAPTSTPVPQVTVYLVTVERINAFLNLITTPPYVPPPTATPLPTLTGSETPAAVTPAGTADATAASTTDASAPVSTAPVSAPATDVPATPVPASATP